MAKILFTIFLAFLFITFIKFTKADKTKDMAAPTTKDQDNAGSDLNNLNMQELMNMCNESFRIEMDYLKALNETGSFLDESDRTPKCFIRCMLENTGVLTDDGQIDSARAAMVFAGERNGKPMNDIEDFTARCATDRREKCLCEKSYNFIRCLMSLEIDKFGMSQ